MKLIAHAQQAMNDHQWIVNVEKKQSERMESMPFPFSHPRSLLLIFRNQFLNPLLMLPLIDLDRDFEHSNLNLYSK